MRLAADPGLVPQAVQEVLRFEPITPFTARICLEDVEHRGVTFPAGTIVAVCAERGNREDENGEEFDITAERDGRRPRAPADGPRAAADGPRAAADGPRAAHGMLELV